jgi:hypothetical protein
LAQKCIPVRIFRTHNLHGFFLSFPFDFCVARKVSERLHNLQKAFHRVILKLLAEALPLMKVLPSLAGVLLSSEGQA